LEDGQAFSRLESMPPLQDHDLKRGVSQEQSNAKVFKTDSSSSSIHHLLFSSCLQSFTSPSCLQSSLSSSVLSNHEGFGKQLLKVVGIHHNILNPDFSSLSLLLESLSASPHVKQCTFQHILWVILLSQLSWPVEVMQP
jgi:hypothetical protein